MRKLYISYPRGNRSPAGPSCSQFCARLLVTRVWEGARGKRQMICPPSPCPVTFFPLTQGWCCLVSGPRTAPIGNSGSQQNREKQDRCDKNMLYTKLEIKYFRKDNFIRLHYPDLTHFSFLWKWIFFVVVSVFQLYYYYYLGHTIHIHILGKGNNSYWERALFVVSKSFLHKYGAQNYLVAFVKMQIPWPTKSEFDFGFVRLYFSGLQNHYRWWLQPWN